MANAADFYRSSYGDLRLWLSRFTTSAGRTQVVHEPSAGPDFVVQDRGPVLLRTRCSVLFDWMVGDELAPIDRIRRLRALVNDKPRVLRHPVEGSFLARVGPFDYEVQDNVITAELEFVQVGEIEAVAPAGAGGIPAAGEGAVTAAAEALAAELTAIGVTSTLPTDATTAADGWGASEDLNPREVAAQTGSLTSSLGELADDMDDSLGTWAAFKATIILGEAVRRAAESATSETAQTFTLRVGAPVALRALVASIYGADEASARYTQVMQLNDIANPAWLEPGTELAMPALAGAARTA